MTAQALSPGRAPSYNDYPASPRKGTLMGGKRALATDQPTAARPQVSIITIVRNGSRTISRTIDSVLSQDFPGLEYIVVDGGSEDGTVEILRAREDNIALWISEADRGISDAFNKGIALSRGEVIGVLNSDDWYEPGTIHAVVAEMQRTDADIACGPLQYWDGDSRTFLTDSDPAKLEQGMTVGHPTVFVRSDCYRRLGLFRHDFRLAMDYEWLLRAKSSGARFVVVDRCLANMRAGGVGDMRWRNSQREVARARALYVEGADNAFAYHAFVARRIVMGSVRRLLDTVGLGVLRRFYHRHLSPVKVVSTRDNNTR